MKIINFSGGTEDLPDNPTHPKPASPKPGRFHFTCSHCDAKMTADFDAMIFRTMECECAECGTTFRIANPAYPSKTIKRSTKP